MTNDPEWNAILEHAKKAQERSDALGQQRREAMREAYANGATLAELNEPFNGFFSIGFLEKVVDGVVVKQSSKAKLTLEQMEIIRGSYKNGFATQAQLAERYEVSQQTISRIVKNET